MASRGEIIAVASKLFVEKGFEKTTMGDIANALGVHKGSLYHHISSKSEIFYEIVMLGFKDSGKELEQVRISGLEPMEKLKKAVSVHFENILRNSLEYQVLLNERRYMLDPEQEDRVRRQMKAYENSLFEILKQGVEAGVFRDNLKPRVIVAGIIGVGNAIYKWFSFNGPLDYGDVARTYAEFFITGIMKKGPCL